jgi:putative sterol carrier protein
MADPSVEFFDGLSEQGHLPHMEKVSGILRFDVVDGKRTARWFLTIKKGDLAVSRQGGTPDCTVKVDKVLFEEIVNGKVNAFAATLRGEVEIGGDPELMVVFQRVLPGPPASAAEPVGSRS